MARKNPVFKQHDEFRYAMRNRRGPVEPQKWAVKLPSGSYIFIEANNEGQLRGKLNQLKRLKRLKRLKQTSGGQGGGGQ